MFSWEVEFSSTQIWYAIPFRKGGLLKYFSSDYMLKLHSIFSMKEYCIVFYPKADLW